MRKEYVSVEILDMIKEYFNIRFKLRENSDVMIFYNKEFFFNCVERKNMTSVCKVNLDEIYDSCNSVDSVDDKFENKSDLLEELNEITEEKDIVQYIVKYFEDVYGIICISE